MLIIDWSSDLCSSDRGVQDTAQAKRIIGATATLEYRAAVEGNAYDAVASGSVPPDARVYYRKELGPDGKPIPILLSKRVIATGEQLVDARYQPDPQTGTPAVSVTPKNGRASCRARVCQDG